MKIFKYSFLRRCLASLLFSLIVAFQGASAFASNDGIEQDASDSSDELSMDSSPLSVNSDTLDLDQVDDLPFESVHFLPPMNAALMVDGHFLLADYCLHRACQEPWLQEEGVYVPYGLRVAHYLRLAGAALRRVLETWMGPSCEGIANDQWDHISLIRHNCFGMALHLEHYVDPQAMPADARCYHCNVLLFLREALAGIALGIPRDHCLGDYGLTLFHYWQGLMGAERSHHLYALQGLGNAGLELLEHYERERQVARFQVPEYNLWTGPSFRLINFW